MFIVDKCGRFHWSCKCRYLVNARKCRFTWVSGLKISLLICGSDFELLFLRVIVLSSPLQPFFFLNHDLKNVRFKIFLYLSLPLTRSSLLCRWAMSSLTLKGKPSEQAPVASANSGTPLTSTTSNASSGLHLDY